MFPSDLDKFRPLLVPDSVLFFRGEVDRRREEPSLRVTDVIPLEQADERLAAAVLLRVPASSDEAILEKLRTVLTAHTGERPGFLEITTPAHLRVTVRCNGHRGITPTAECLADLADLLGPDAVILVPPQGANRRRTRPTEAPPAVESPAAAVV